MTDENEQFAREVIELTIMAVCIHGIFSSNADISAEAAAKRAYVATQELLRRIDSHIGKSHG